MKQSDTAAMGRARAESGFTLIEVLVATVVLAIGIGALFGMLVVSNHTTATNRVRQAGTSLARELIEDTRGLAYTQLNTAALPGALQPQVPGSTVSGPNLLVTRGIYSFSVSFTACSLDDPADGYGDHSSPPASGGSWCPDVAPSGSTDTTPDDYKRVSVTVTPTGARNTPQVQQTALIYARAIHGPAVTCLSVSGSCPGTNQTVTSGTSSTFNVTTTITASSIQWLVNGSAPPSSQIPTGAVDPYTPSGTTSQFTWNYPAADGTYTIGAIAFDANGNSGTRSAIQISLNRHQAIPPASVSSGFNPQINGVDVQWVPSIDQDILYYRVYHQYGSTPAAVVTGCSQVVGLSCTDLSAPSPLPEPSSCTGTPGQSYTTTNQYWVVGVDTDPTTGQPRESTQLSSKIDANLCNHPPSPPTGLNGSVSSGAMSLNWTPPSSPGDPDPGDSIQEWRIYRWPATGSVSFPNSRLDLIGAVNGSGNQVTNYTDPSADPGGVTQNYCVTSVDTQLGESPCSNTVSG